MSGYIVQDEYFGDSKVFEQADYDEAVKYMVALAEKYRAEGTERYISDLVSSLSVQEIRAGMLDKCPVHITYEQWEEEQNESEESESEAS